MQIDGRVKHVDFVKKNTTFIKACRKVKIKPTTRQASKWRMKRGLAWEKGRIK